MREKLRERAGERHRYTALVIRFGNGRGGRNSTLLLRDVRGRSGEVLTDHVWLRVGERVESAHLKEGSRISFKATARAYTKRGGELDYKLANPTDLVKLKAATAQLTLEGGKVGENTAT